MRSGTIVAVVGIAVLAGAAGYWLGHREGSSIGQPSEMGAGAPMAESPGGQHKILHYRNPMNPSDTSPVPRKDPMGMDYVPVYQTAPSKMLGGAMPSAGKGKILYYRNPMGLPDTSPVPKKDAMGMAYVPVYESGANVNEVQISADRMQTLGVRTASVQLLALTRSIRATGVVQFDERRLAIVTTKAGGWVEKLDVAATGEAVRAGQQLLEIYSPDLVTAEDEYLVAARMRALPGHMHGGSTLLVDTSIRRLRALDVPEVEIRRLRSTGQAAHQIAVLAPADGIVTEKDAVLGMHFDPGSPLYKTADLSVVWLIAQVQEQDLGAIKAGQRAHATFVAFPGRIFDGVVDFVYPMLMADTRTAKVRIAIPNGDQALRESMYATVNIETPIERGTPVVTVPDSAVIDSGTRQVVLISKGEGHFEPRAVHLGARGDGYDQILDGVKPGDQVVVGANFLIDAESNLRSALQSFSSGSSAQTGGASP